MKWINRHWVWLPIVITVVLCIAQMISQFDINCLSIIAWALLSGMWFEKAKK
jgi:hypothetical protein